MPDNVTLEFGQYFKVSIAKARQLEQTLFVVGELIECLRSNKCCTVRDVYYMNVDLLKSTRTVQRILDHMADFLEIYTDELPILPSLKGLCYGSVTITMTDGTLINRTCNNEPMLIPYIKKIQQVTFHASVLLIVEKDAAFQNIVHMCVAGELSNLFVVTGKGYPDLNTQTFVYSFGGMFDSVHVLVDIDPHGLSIFKTYLNQATSPDFDLKLIELPMKDLNPSSLTSRDYKMLSGLFHIEKLRLIAQKLFFVGCKYEIEQMSNNDLVEYLRMYITIIDSMVDLSSSENGIALDDDMDLFSDTSYYSSHDQLAIYPGRVEEMDPYDEL